MQTEPDVLSCISWNIHRGRGNDGVVDAMRTLDVLRDEVWVPGCDALILQEADEETPPHRGILDITRLEAETGLRHLHKERHTRWGAQSDGFLGVMMFLAPCIRVQDLVLLDLPGHCHRGAVIVDAERQGRRFRLVGTHLSLTQGLRIMQLRTLGQHLFRRDQRQTILCGDLNEWRPWGGFALSRHVLGARFRGPAAATFPIRWPMLALDRVMTTAPARVSRLRVLDGKGIRMASDHRPLVAEIVLGD